MTTATVKIQARGTITLPKKMRSKLGADIGGMVDIVEQNGGFFISPVARLDTDIVSMLRSAQRDIARGDYIEFSSVQEFHKKRAKKWGKKK